MIDKIEFTNNQRTGKMKIKEMFEGKIITKMLFGDSKKKELAVPVVLLKDVEEIFKDYKSPSEVEELMKTIMDKPTWDERINIFQINPHAASVEDISKMATELSDLRFAQLNKEQVDILRDDNKKLNVQVNLLSRDNYRLKRIIKELTERKCETCRHYKVHVESAGSEDEIIFEDCNHHEIMMTFIVEVVARVINQETVKAEGV